MDMATLLDMAVAITEDMTGTATLGDTVHMVAITEDMDTMPLMGPTTTVDTEPTTIMDQMVSKK